MAKKDFNDEDGVWRTIGGRKVFIRKGQNLADAMIESGKFSKKGKMRENYRKEKEKDEKEAKDLLEEYERKQRAKEYDDINDTRVALKHKTDDNFDKYEETMDEKFAKEKKYDDLGKAYPYREQYKQENEYNFENIKDWKRYRDANQKALNRTTIPFNAQRNLNEINVANKEIEKSRKNLDESADEILGKQDKSTNEKPSQEILDALRSEYIYQDEPSTQEYLEKSKKRYGEKAVNDAFKYYDDNYVVVKGTNVDTEGLGYNSLLEKKDYPKEALDQYLKDMENLRNSGLHYRDTHAYNEKSRELLDNLKQATIKDAIKKDIAEKQNKSANEKFGYNDARDILNQLNSEGSDFTFGEIEVDKYNQNYKDTGKLKTEVSVFMPDERGYTTRELEIPINKNETRESFEEKLRDWQSRHNSPDTWEDKDFKSTNETMNNAIREKASKTGKKIPSNLSRDIYKLDEDKGNAWSGNGTTKNANGETIARVTKNGPSQNSPQDIKEAIEKKYPYLKGKILGNNEVQFSVRKEETNTINNTMNNAIREKANNKYAGTKRWGFGYANDDNIPVYDNKIDYGGDFSHANLQTLSDSELKEALNKQTELLNKANAEKVGDRRTRNGRMQAIFNKSEKLRYNNGVNRIKEELVRRENEKYPQYKGTPYEVKYYSLEDVMKDKDSPLNQYIRNKANEKKAYRDYLKEHPESKMSLKDFRNMKK